MELAFNTILDAIQGNADAIEQIVLFCDNYIDRLIADARIRSGGWLPRCDDNVLKNHMQNALRSAIPRFEIRV